jgi:phage terminase large subunit-like protein
MPTSEGSKFVRAQSCAAVWNAGRILLPTGAPWLEEFIAEVCGFTDRRTATTTSWS